MGQKLKEAELEVKELKKTTELEIKELKKTTELEIKELKKTNKNLEDQIKTLQDTNEKLEQGKEMLQIGVAIPHKTVPKEDERCRRNLRRQARRRKRNAVVTTTKKAARMMNVENGPVVRCVNSMHLCGGNKGCSGGRQQESSFSQVETRSVRSRCGRMTVW